MLEIENQNLNVVHNLTFPELVAYKVFLKYR